MTRNEPHPTVVRADGAGPAADGSEATDADGSGGRADADGSDGRVDGGATGDRGAAGDPVLECRNLTKRFGGITAVHDVTTAFEAGTIHGLIGPNGAGKTTFFNLLSGFLAPDSGEVLFDGVAVTDYTINRRARVGLARTFQETRVFGGLTLLENLYVAAEMDVRTLLGSDPGDATRDRAHELLDLVGLAELRDDPADDLSYGQKKLLDFVTVLMTEPTVVLLDEPVAGINPGLINEIETIVREMRDQGVTPIVVEHNMDFAMGLCDEISVMHQGALIATGSPAEIQADQTVIDAYLGGA